MQESAQSTAVIEQLKYDNERLKLALTQRLSLRHFNTNNNNNNLIYKVSLWL